MMDETAKDQKSSTLTTRERFRQCLRDIDQYLKERKFKEARIRFAEAIELEPTNPYLPAFEERIRLFESNPDLSARIGAPPKKATPGELRTAMPTSGIHRVESPADIERRLRKQIEMEYKEKFMEELRKAEEQAVKSLEEERKKLEQQRLILKSQHEQQLALAQKRLEAEYQKRLDAEIEIAESRLRQEFQSEQSFLEQEMKTRLSEHYERQLKELEDKLKKEHEKLLEKERASASERERILREQFQKQLSEKLEEQRRSFTNIEPNIAKANEAELRRKLQAEFEEKLIAERASIQKQFEEPKVKLQQSFETEQQRLKAEYEKKVNDELDKIRAQELESFEKQRLQIKQELENELKKQFQKQLEEERISIQTSAAEEIEREKKKIHDEYAELIAHQNERIKKIRSELRNEMEQNFLRRLEQVAKEYDQKMELFGVNVPETKTDAIAYYSRKMKQMYSNGEPSVEDARKIMELKELLGITFDEHFSVESEVRRSLYIENIEQMIKEGKLTQENLDVLSDVAAKYRISPEDVEQLKPFVESSFQRLKLKGSLLVVDDDTAFLTVLVNELTSVGYNVISAESVDQALEILKNTTVDLIIADIKFPPGQLDGFKFFEITQQQPRLREIPFIFMSALTDGVFIRSGVQLGVDDYLTKPLDFGLLCAVIEGKIKRFRRLSENQPCES